MLLFPIAAVCGLNTPVLDTNDELTQLPMLGVTVNCTAPSLLQNGPTFDMLGTGGLDTCTVIVLESGHKLVLGID